MSAAMILLFGVLPSGQFSEVVTDVAGDLAALGFDVSVDRLALEWGQEVERVADSESVSLKGDDAWCVFSEFLDSWTLKGTEEIFGFKEDTKGKETFIDPAAYYDVEKEKIIFLRPRLGEEGEMPSERTIAHELIHAWRDQVSGLALLQAACGTTTDERLVFKCIIEGEAVSAAFGVDLQRKGITPWRLTEELRESTPGGLHSLMPADGEYYYGTRFMLSEWRRGGWAAVRSAINRQPPSTEQLLHNCKLGLDEPTVVTIPELPEELGEGSTLYSDCVGELGVYKLLRRARVPHERAWVAAIGWDGDQFLVCDTGGGNEVRLWRTLWDREKDAQQFVQAIAASVDASIAISGRAVDLVRSTDGELEEKLVTWLESAGPVYDPCLLDQETTELVEAKWLEDQANRPFVEDEHWVLPECGVRLPILDQWDVVDWSHGQLHCRLDGKTVGVTRVFPIDWLAGVPEQDQLLTALDDATSRKQRRSRSGLLEAKIKDYGAGRYLWLQESGVDAETVVDLSTILARPGAPIEIRTAVLRSHLQILLPDIEEMARSCSFDLDPQAGGGVDLSDPDEVILGEEPRRADIEVLDFDGVPIAGCRVRVMHMREKRLSDRAERTDSIQIEALARVGGRWFVTGDQGVVTVPLKGDVSWACATAGESFGAVEIRSKATHRRASIHLRPKRSLVVRVVDEATQPRSGVPVGLLVVRGGVQKIYDVKSSSSPDGEVRWEDALRVPDGLLPDDEIYVLLAFPMARASRARPCRLWPDGISDDEIELVVPDTGELVLSVSVLDEETIPASIRTDLLEPEPLLEVRGSQDSDGFDWGGHQMGPFFSWEKGGVLSCTMGLGLEIDVRLFGGLASVKVLGPIGSEEHVQLDAPVVLTRSVYGWARLVAALEVPSVGPTGIHSVYIAESQFAKGGARQWSCRLASVDEYGRVQGFASARDGSTAEAIQILVFYDDRWVETFRVPLDRVREGAETDLGEVRTRVAVDCVAGYVVTEDGDPVDGAQCVLIREAQGSESAVGIGESRKGVFFIGGPFDEGQYSLHVSATGYETTVMESVKGAGRSRIVTLKRE